MYLWAIMAMLFVRSMTIDWSNDIYFEEPSLENKLVMGDLKVECPGYSLVHCSAICLQYLCECFGFNPTTQTCRVHAFCRRNSTFVDLTEWKYYKREWTRFLGSEYWIGREQYNWTNAVMVCKIKGAKLVEIESLEEDNFIRYLTEVEYAGESVWFGGNDLDTEGRWVWNSNNELFSYSAWATAYQQPDNLHDEDCLHIYLPFDLKWVDGQCPDKHYYICEKEVS